MSEQTLQLVDVIRQRLALAIRRISLADAAFGLAITFGLAAFSWTVATLLETSLWLGSTPRTLLLVVVVLAVGVAFVALAARPLLRLARILPSTSERDVANLIGARFPEVGDRLRNLLDLSDGRASTAPDSMVDGAVRMLGQQVVPIRFEQVEDFQRVRRAARVASFPALVLLIFVVAAPGPFFSASHRLVSPTAKFERPAPHTLNVSPGSVEIIRGSDLQFAIHAEGRQLPNAVSIAIRQEEEEDHVEHVQAATDTAGAFHYAMRNVRRPFRYRAESSAATSPWYLVTVLERPVIRGLQVALHFPSYSRLGTRRLEPNVGDVTALPGTRVNVDVGLGNQQLRGASLVFDDGAQQELAISGGRAVGSFTLRKVGRYAIRLESARGIENEDPVSYNLELLEDVPPSIVLTSPEPSTELERELRVPVEARIRDDYGFSALRLFYRLAESRYKAVADSFETIDLPLDPSGEIDQSVRYLWLLDQSTRLDPVPGDVVEFFVRVWDNDAWAGFKPATSPRHRLVVPSLTERYRHLDQQQNEAVGELNEILDATETIRQQFDALREELRRNQQGSWESERQVEQIQKRQEEVQQRIEDFSERIDAMTQEMESNELISPETANLYRELQKVVDEIHSPELHEALERLREAMQQLNLQDLQQSVAQYDFNEQQYRERLERTLELFKNLRTQQQLDEAARRAEELANREADLARRTEELKGERTASELTEEAERQDQRSTRAESQSQDEPATLPEPDGTPGSEDEAGAEQEDSRHTDDREEQATDRSGSSSETSAEDLAREQERAQEDARDLMERLENAAQQMDGDRNRRQSQLEQLVRDAQTKQIPQKMQENADELRQNRLGEAQKGQQQLSQDLQQIAQNIRSMQQEMAGNQMSMNVAGIRQALEDVLTLSQRQESARQDVQQLAPDSPRLRDYAQEQVRLGEGLSVVADSLQQFSRQIPQMSRVVQQLTGEALQEMSAATGALADRSARTGAVHQQGAMMQLNELALVLADLLDQMMNGGGSGSGQSMQRMIEQLQQMVGEQEQLNQQVQDFLNDMQGNRLSTDSEQRLRQMSEQQQALQRQLREVARNSEARGKLMSDLNRIAEQMEETIQELRGAQTDRQTIERQQQILTRLLDAQKSLQNRGREERREARPADDLVGDSPTPLSPTDEVERLRRDLIRALEAGYAPEYQEMIKRYFQLLQRQTQPADDLSE